MTRKLNPAAHRGGFFVGARLASAAAIRVRITGSFLPFGIYPPDSS
jgi:hypothetical protein